MSRYKKLSEPDGSFDHAWRSAPSDNSQQPFPATQDARGWAIECAPSVSANEDVGWLRRTSESSGDGIAAPRPRRFSSPAWDVFDGVVDSPSHSIGPSSILGSKLTPPESGSASGVRVCVPSHYQSHSTDWGFANPTPVLLDKSNEHSIGLGARSSSIDADVAHWLGPASASGNRRTLAEQSEEQRREAVISEVLRALEDKYNITATLKSHNPTIVQNDWNPAASSSKVDSGARLRKMFSNPYFGPSTQIFRHGDTATNVSHRECEPTFPDVHDASTYSEDSMITPKRVRTYDQRKRRSAGSPGDAWLSQEEDETDPQNKDTRICDNSNDILSMAKDLIEIKEFMSTMLDNQHEKIVRSNSDVMLTMLMNAVGELKQLNRANKTLVGLLEKAPIAFGTPLKVSLDDKVVENIDPKGIATGSSGFLRGASNDSCENVNAGVGPVHLSDTHSQRVSDLTTLKNSGTLTSHAPHSIAQKLAAHVNDALTEPPLEKVLEERAKKIAENALKECEIKKNTELVEKNTQIAAKNVEIADREKESIVSIAKVQFEAENAYDGFRKLCKDKDAKIALLEEQKELLETELEKANLKLASLEPSEGYRKHEAGVFRHSAPKAGIRGRIIGKPSYEPLLPNHTSFGNLNNDPAQLFSGRAPPLFGVPSRLLGGSATSKHKVSNTTFNAAPALSQPKMSTMSSGFTTATRNSTSNGNPLLNCPSSSIGPFGPLPAPAPNTSSSLFGNSVAPASGNLDPLLLSTQFGSYNPVVSANTSTRGGLFGNLAVDGPSGPPYAPIPEVQTSSIFSVPPSSGTHFPPGGWFGHGDSAPIPSVPGAFPVGANEKTKVATVESDDEDI